MPKKDTCPLPNQCTTENVIYQAELLEVESNNVKTYIGLTSDTFKLRFGNHKKSFSNPEYASETSLSKHIWKLKNSNIEIKLTGKLLTEGDHSFHT